MKRRALNLKPLITVADHVRYIGRLFWRTAPGWTLLIVVVNFLTGLSAPLIVWSMERIVNALVQGEPAAHVTLPLVALFVALLLESIGQAGTDFAAAVVREHMDDRVRSELLQAAASIPLDDYETPAFYQKLDNAYNIVGGSSVLGALEDLSAFISATTSTVGLLILFGQAHPLLALAMLVTMIVRAVLGARAESNYYDVNYDSTPDKREMQYWSGLMSGRQTLPEVRLYGLENHLRHRWTKVFDRYYTNIHRARIENTMAWIRSSLFQESMSLVIIFVLLTMGLRGTITVGALTALLYGVAKFRSIANTYTWSIAQTVDFWRPVADLRHFISLGNPPESASSERLQSEGLPSEDSPSRGAPTRGTSPRSAPPEPTPAHETDTNDTPSQDDGLPKMTFQSAIEFRNVGFQYPGSERVALRNINVSFYPGQSVAIVGANGSGKTTLVRLLLGLYAPTEGDIFIDDHNLQHVGAKRWRENATAVFQDYMQYAATVGENIAYGRHRRFFDTDTGEFISDGANRENLLSHVTRLTDAQALVDQLPGGFATRLGRQFEGGTDLSQGQWQKLAVSRALIRGADVIVLDEPTSAMDPRAEIEVYEQFLKAAREKCALIVSHRLGIAKLADRVIVLNEGEIVEDGTHDALMAAQSVYARIFSLQSRWYDEEKGGGAHASRA